MNIISLSGGKDSSAMLLRMIELDYPIDAVVFADTMMEFPEIYTWLADLEKLIPYPITRTMPIKSFDSWFYGVAKFGRRAKTGKNRGFPLSYFGCYWRRESKIYPIRRLYNNSGIHTFYIGIAADEAKRANAACYNGKHIYKFPLIEWGWKESDCIAYLEKIGKPHPLAQRFKRSGCWLCPKQSLKSLKALYCYYPDLWKRLLTYEKESDNVFKPGVRLVDLEKRFKQEGAGG